MARSPKLHHVKVKRPKRPKRAVVAQGSGFKVRRAGAKTTRAIHAHKKRAIIRVGP